VIENVFYLKLIFVVLVTCAEHSELVGEVQAFAEVFGSDKIKCDFDAIVNVDNLMWRSSRDENGVTFVLYDRVAVDSFVLQAFSECRVDEPVLRRVESVKIRKKKV
jgi:hypothetical protein